MAKMTKRVGFQSFKAEGAKEESSATSEMWEWEKMGLRRLPWSAGASGRNLMFSST